ncbi:MAG: hypothetical protein WBV82_31645 [Myxococcaceae bacterium]
MNKLFSEAPGGHEMIHAIVTPYADMLRRTLSQRYETANVTVTIKPELFGRMRLVLDGDGVDLDTERERIWTIAEQVSKWVYS